MRSTAKLATALCLLTALGACGNNDKGQTQEAAPAASSTAPTALPRSTAPQAARLYFIEPTDGATVTSPVRIEFGLDGMDVVPAGTEAPMSGHHHVIIDAELPAFDQPIPADEHHVHFGDGRTVTDLPLAPGEHTLQLLLGDHLHIPHQPPVSSEVITITVE
ncbi:DUF4399 domain-containing protein [Woeseia oceani]|uniref:DUF4399 domain-containing protein n=1 Tax=Woeseia oceani TaxID=1548547 RepID=UPI0018D380CF|nr:DUF4399 domain-containing protein [Woeseia oceani]